MGTRQNRDGERFFLLQPRATVARNRLTEATGTKETDGTGRRKVVAVSRSGRVDPEVLGRSDCFRLKARSLTLMEVEGICGRFGRFGDDRLHVGPLGREPDDVDVSFTTCGSRYFGNLAHM